ncbi:TPA: hypothetical protein I7721_19630 [Vibrio vulnificus]|nr:hypothetical protein [Vibrio vulnificus]
MNYSMFAIMCIALSAAFFNQFYTENKKNLDFAAEQSKAGQFMIYVSAFDDFHKINTTVTGEVTGFVKIPEWLPENKNIKMVIEGGVGYIYMPDSPGLMDQVIKLSNNSSHVGISNNTEIMTVSGGVIKPNFIGSGYIVFMR